MSLLSNRQKGHARRDLLAEARYFRLMQNLRALLVVLPVVAVLAWLGSSLLSQPKIEIPQNEWKSQTLSAVHSQKEILDIVRASRAAFNEYITIDRVRPQLDRATKMFEKVRSESDLVWALNELARTSGDKYVEVLTINQYNDRMARQQGKTIGVDIEFTNQFGSRAYTISRCPTDSEAYAEGLRVGDELISIDNTHIDQMALGQPWQATQRLKQIVDSGLLGSTVQIFARRVDVYITATIHRTVLPNWRGVASFTASPLRSTSGEMSNGAGITIQNLWNPDTLPRLADLLKRFEQNEVGGIILDLQQVNGCDGDTAVQLAALFMESGVIAHRISVQPDGTLLMHSWEAKNGKVQLTTKGPFAVTADGALDKTAQAADKVETLNWESNVFTGTVVVMMGEETSGGGEVIAAALMPDLKRHVVTSEFLTAGKGTYTSYYQVGAEHMLSISTAFYLRPDGTSIEAGVDGKSGRIMPNAIPNGGANSIEEFAQQLLEERLSVIPAPDLPPPPAADDGGAVKK